MISEECSMTLSGRAAPQKAHWMRPLAESSCAGRSVIDYMMPRVPPELCTRPVGGRSPRFHCYRKHGWGQREGAQQRLQSALSKLRFEQEVCSQEVAARTCEVRSRIPRLNKVVTSIPHRVLELSPYTQGSRQPLGLPANHRMPYKGFPDARRAAGLLEGHLCRDPYDFR